MSRLELGRDRLSSSSGAARGRSRDRATPSLSGFFPEQIRLGKASGSEALEMSPPQF